MEFGDPREAYRVKEGQKLKLDEARASTTELCPHGSKDQSEELMQKYREEIQHLQKMLFAQHQHRVLVIMQAMDTGGKDGCIKHVFASVDPQGINVHAFKKPSEVELRHDFLWRIHPHVPGNGEIVIFNRSHYEDIIAVRVKKIFEDAVWKRRYRHVLDFEKMLADEGTTIIKIFLHISKEEQKERLEKRLENPAKHWKFNVDDLKDRACWDDFKGAYEDLISKTSTAHAPWYVVPADKKWYRNLCVGKIFIDTLKDLGMEFPCPDFDPSSIRIDG